VRRFLHFIEVCAVFAEMFAAVAQPAEQRGSGCQVAAFVQMLVAFQRFVP
jgi:hypothetical protein